MSDCVAVHKGNAGPAITAWQKDYTTVFQGLADCGQVVAHRDPDPSLEILDDRPRQLRTRSKVLLAPLQRLAPGPALRWRDTRITHSVLATVSLTWHFVQR
jgi:hypothetical protein